MAYDVRSDSAEGRRRLRKVAQICLNYGQRVQYSVFECRVDEKAYHRLRVGIESIVNAKEDSIRIYGVDTSRTWVYGIDRYVDFDAPLIY